jgi:hypothetical protein
MKDSEHHHVLVCKQGKRTIANTNSLRTPFSASRLQRIMAFRQVPIPAGPHSAFARTITFKVPNSGCNPAAVNHSKIFEKYTKLQSTGCMQSQIFRIKPPRHTWFLLIVRTAPALPACRQILPFCIVCWRITGKQHTVRQRPLGNLESKRYHPSIWKV